MSIAAVVIGSTSSFSVGEWAIAAAVVLGAVGSFVTSIAQLRQGKATVAKVEAVADKTDEVHELVNDKSLVQDARVEQLAGALTGAGVTIPPRPGVK